MLHSLFGHGRMASATSPKREPLLRSLHQHLCDQMCCRAVSVGCLKSVFRQASDYRDMARLKREPFVPRCMNKTEHQVNLIHCEPHRRWRPT